MKLFIVGEYCFGVCGLTLRGDEPLPPPAYIDVGWLEELAAAKSPRNIEIADCGLAEG